MTPLLSNDPDAPDVPDAPKPRIKILQIEITTNCNFRCLYCSHAHNPQAYSEQNSEVEGLTEQLNEYFMPVKTFEHLARTSFGELERLILYGVGEPLTHPHFIPMLDIARKYLPAHAQIEFTTNGSFLTPAILDQIVPYRIHRIIFSLDTPFIVKNQAIRPGFTASVQDNLIYLGEVQRAGKIDIVAIESVISKVNLHDLPYLVDFCHEIGISIIYFSHLLPFSQDMHDQVLYIPVSKMGFEIMVDIVESGWEILNQVILTPKYNKFIETEKHPKIRHIFQSLDEARKNGIDIDLRKLTPMFQKMPQIQETLQIFDQVRDRADQWEIAVDIPPLFVDHDHRECPFAVRDALFVTVQGDIVPCYNFAHTHTLFIDEHERVEAPHIVGGANILTMPSSITNLLTTSEYQVLAARLKNLAEKVPWCGECIYSTQNCFYVKDNLTDCYGNQPGCNECLYSAGFVKCLFD